MWTDKLSVCLHHCKQLHTWLQQGMHAWHWLPRVVVVVYLWKCSTTCPGARPVVQLQYDSDQLFEQPGGILQCPQLSSGCTKPNTSFNINLSVLRRSLLLPPSTPAASAGEHQAMCPSGR